MTFERFVETHRRTLPGRIDRSVMPTMSGGDQSRIISALHFMGLTDPQSDVPTDLFVHLKDAGDDAEALQAAWAEALRRAYPKAFTPPFDLTTATQGQLNENFAEAFGISGESVRKATAFFIALARIAGIPLSGYFRQTRVRAPGSGAKPQTPSRPKIGRGGPKQNGGQANRTQTPPDNGDLGALAATWRLPNGVVARLYVNGHVFSEPKPARDNLLKIADKLNEYNEKGPTSREAEPEPDGAAES